jgi:hypothetical protein
MGRKPLVIRNRSLRIVAKREYMFFDEGERRRYVIAYRHLSALFLDRRVEVTLGDMMKIVRHIPIYLLDGEGVIRAAVTGEGEG